jgi:tape measure domain-containing protein
MSNLGLVTDSDIAKLKSLEIAFESLKKQFGALSKIVPELNKVFVGYEKVISSLEKKNENLVSKVDRLTQAQEKQRAATGANANVLAKQKNILDGMIAGYSRGESSILATAKAAGVAGKSFKELETVLAKQRAISGKNPFDDTTSSLIKMERQLKVSKQVLSELGSGYAATSKDAAEFVRFQERLKIAAEQAANAHTGPSGKTRALAGGAREVFIEKRIKVETAAYAALREEIRKTDKAAADLVETKRNEARANKKNEQDLIAVEKQLKRTRIETELAKEGFSRVTATGVAGLQLRGASPEVIDSYKKMRLEIEKIQKEANRTGGALKGLSTIGRELFPALGAVGVVATFGMLTRKVILTTDAYNLLAARIKLVSSKNEKFSDTQEKLLTVASNTRQSFEAVGKLYARLVPALESVGGSSTDALIATEQLAGSLLRSGTSVAEAESAILQFSQALGSGKLAGDEFRSLSEAAPAFLKGLADALGVPTTSMRLFAEEGKLTTEVVSAGTIIMAESFRDLGKSMPITVGQAFQQLTNILFVRTSELNNALGGNKGLAESILNISKSLDTGLQSLTAFVKENEKFVEDIFKGVSILTTALGIFGAYKLLLLATVPIIKVAGSAMWAFGTATLALSASTRAAAVGTTSLSLSMKALSSGNAIGLIITGLATTYLFLADSSDEASKAQEEVAKATRASAKRLEEARIIVGNFSDEVAGLARGSLKELVAGFDELYKDQLKLNDQGLQLALGMNDQEFALYKLEKAYIAASVSEKKAMQEKAEHAFVMGEQIVKQQQLNDTISLSTEASKSYKDQAESLRKQINERTKSIAELKAIEEQLLNVKLATIEADIIALEGSKDFNEITRLAIAKKKQELSDLREVIALTVQLNKIPEKVASSGGTRVKEIDEYKKLNDSLKEYILSLSAQSESLSKAQVFERDYAKLKGKTSEETKEVIKANIAEAKSLELLSNLKKANVDREKELEDLRKNDKSTLDDLQGQINETVYQTKIIGLNTDAIRDLELAKIDDMITTLEYRAVVQAMQGEYASEVTAIETQIKKWRELREEKQKLFGAQRKDELKNKEKETLENQQKEYEKLFEDVGQLFGEAIFKGGDDAVKDLGKSIKNYFRTLTIRLAIEPAIKNIGQQFLNLSNDKDFNAESFGSSLNQLVAGSNGGTTGALLSAGLSTVSSNLNNEGFRLIGEGFSSMGAEYVKLSSTVGTVATYAGSIAKLLEGDVKGAALTAAGTYIGNILLPGIGGAIGGYLAGLLGGGNKISASSFGADFGQNLSKELSKQYIEVVKSLGGVSSDISFNAWGNTGRQGENNNFTLSALQGGRSIFNSSNTSEGQADGLFLSGEIALNDASLADQSLRALFSALKETDFADNIDNVIKKLDLFSATTEELNTALLDVNLLRALNEALPKLGSAMATLAGQSIELINSFIEMAGGIDNLKSLQSEYISSIYTEQEQIDLTIKNLEDAFARLGVAVPSTAAEYKALVDAQDLSSRSGQLLYLSLLQLAPAFKQVEEIALNLKSTIANELIDSISKQIDISKEMSNKARESSADYFEAVNSLKEASNSLLFNASSSQGQASITKSLFEKTFKKAITGDISALEELASRGTDLQSSFANQAKSREELFFNTILLKNQLEQAASVAEVLGLGASAEAKMLDVQTSSLETLKEGLASGKLTQDILSQHSLLLENIAQRITEGSSLFISASRDSTGQSFGTLLGSSGSVLADLSNDTLLNLKSLQNQSAGGYPVLTQDYQNGSTQMGDNESEIFGFNPSSNSGSNRETIEMMKKANREMVEEIRELKNEVSLLLATTQQGVINAAKTTRILEDVTQNGTSISTVAA